MHFSFFNFCFDFHRAAAPTSGAGSGPGGMLPGAKRRASCTSTRSACSATYAGVAVGRGPGRVAANLWQFFGKMLLVFGCILDCTVRCSTCEDEASKLCFNDIQSHLGSFRNGQMSDVQSTQ